MNSNHPAEDELAAAYREASENAAELSETWDSASDEAWDGLSD